MSVCLLCKSNKKLSKYGEFISSLGINVHYNCLLLSSNLAQNGDDNEGLLGFMPSDIRAESRRVKKQVCFYCKEDSANVGCCHKQCRRTFHFICGIENGAINQFLKTFRSFCNKHLPKLNKVKPIIQDECIICYMNFPRHKIRTMNFTMNVYHQCGKNTLRFFHKNCIQKYANSSGYFFKCPVCNDDTTECKNNFKMQGIFIPDRDAEWETEPHAYRQLEERPKQCVAKKCLYSHGNSSKTRIDVLEICVNCGSNAIHVSCKLDKLPFSCSECTQILTKEEIRKQSPEDEMCCTGSYVIPASQINSELKRKFCVSMEEFDKSDDEQLSKKIVQKKIKFSSPKKFIGKSEVENKIKLSSQVSKNVSCSLDIKEQVQLEDRQTIYVKSKAKADSSNNVPASSMNVMFQIILKQGSKFLQNDLKPLRRKTRSMSCSNEILPINGEFKNCNDTIDQKIKTKNCSKGTCVQSITYKNDNSKPLPKIFTDNFAGSNKCINFLKPRVFNSIEDERNRFMAKLKLRPINQSNIKNDDTPGLMDLQKPELKKKKSKSVQLKLNGDKINNIHLSNQKYENDKNKCKISKKNSKYFRQVNREENLNKKKKEKIVFSYSNDIRKYFFLK